MIRTTFPLRELLRDCRVQSSYEDVNQKRKRASVDSLLVLLRSLGISIERPEQAAEILRERRRGRLGCGIPPVLVAWNGRLKPVDVALPPRASGSMHYRLQSEEGVELAAGKVSIEDLQTELGPDETTYEFATHRLPFRGRIPAGYHRLQIEVGGHKCESLVISAPAKAFVEHEPDTGRPQRHWATFLPLYSLRSAHDWGAGDFRTLSELVQWTGGLGGGAVGTLPLLAASLDEPYEPSPYRPLTRQFWNEFYVDIEAIPELQRCEAARELVNSAAFRESIEKLRGSELVDYRQLMQLKRRALTLLADAFFDERPSRFVQFEDFVAQGAEVEDYARFRAELDRRRSDWRAWPASLHDQVPREEVDAADVRRHLYSQWIAAEQLQSLKERADAAGSGLYLDLPVGVDPGGYDVWRNPKLYITGATTGSPPDPVFTRGQDWGLPPLHPEAIRTDGYRHLRQVLAANMRYARYLRIDHAAGWHRLYAIPQGLGADQGAYLRYYADEIYAVASLESHRNRCTLLAEDLGTVPPVVKRSLKRHGIGEMWVAPYELEPSRRSGFTRPPELSVASLNTHDMPPVAAWWRGQDIDDRRELGLISDEEARYEKADRQAAIAMLTEHLRASGALPLDEEGQEIPVAALLRSLAASPAQLALVGLEDLWMETRPQNVPGTSLERPNWTRKARYSLEEFTRLPEVLDALDQVNALRHRIEKPR